MPWPIILLLAAFAVLSLLAKTITPEDIARYLKKESPKEGGDKQRFHKAASLLSPAERHFFYVLQKAVPEVSFFPKVRVADVIKTPNRFSGDFLRISQKHFDWILCHPSTFEPLIAIELDDTSHLSNRHQIKNDATKHEVAKTAGLTLLRFKCRSEYNPAEIREQITSAVNAL